LLALATRLETAGCPVGLSTTHLLKDQEFASLAAQKREPLTGRTPSLRAIRRGTRLTLPEVISAPAELSARLIDRGGNDHLLEVRNRGDMPLTRMHWELPPDAENWAFPTDVLPEYPIDRLSPASTCGDGTDATVARSSSPQAASGPRATTAAAQARIDRDGIVFMGLLVSV